MFSESTAEKLVESLRPDVYVKGGDYRIEDLPEARRVAEYGGHVYLAQLVPERSTSDLVSAVLAHHPRDVE
jgi:bifunctional ADP-heptose synthase (sugar kinase/adenylyltransferase)